MTDLTVQKTALALQQATVFYATTWSGFQDASNHSSLPVAEKIIDRILDAGHRVVFRPHPWSYKDKTHRKIIAAIAAKLKAARADSGLDHCISNDPLFDHIYPDVNDCIEAADILVSDVTSILADWLFTAKPYVTIDMQNIGSDFGKVNPLTTGGYVTNTALVGLDDALLDATNKDHMREDRLALREAVLGVTLDQSPRVVFQDAINDVFENYDKISNQREKIAQDKVY